MPCYLLHACGSIQASSYTESGLVDPIPWLCQSLHGGSAAFSIVQEAFAKCDISHTGTLLPKVSQPSFTAQHALLCVVSMGSGKCG